MKPKFLKMSKVKISKVIVCALFLSTYSVKPATDDSATEATHRSHQLSHQSNSPLAIALSLGKDVQNNIKNLIKWNEKFLNSSKKHCSLTYKELLVDFGHCAKWFQENVTSKLSPIKRGVALEEDDAMAQAMHVIVQDMNEMMVSMFQMLKELGKEKDPFKFLMKMKTKKPEMDAKFNDILAKIVKLQKDCKNRGLCDLHAQVSDMKKAIVDFKEKNKGAENLVAKRVYAPNFFK